MPIEVLLELLSDIEDDHTTERLHNNVTTLTIVLRETLLKLQALDRTINPK